MAETARRKLPAYLRTIQRLQDFDKLSAGVHHVEVRHDSWCGIFRGEICDCAPEVKVMGARAASKLSHPDILPRAGGQK